MQGDKDKLASIYANALVELAQAKNVLDTVHADVDSLQVLCWSSSRCFSLACLWNELSVMSLPHHASRARAMCEPSKTVSRCLSNVMQGRGGDIILFTSFIGHGPAVLVSEGMSPLVETARRREY